MPNDDQNAPRAGERAAWVPEGEWKRLDQFTAPGYAGSQLRVETFVSRKDPTKVRAWAQFWARAQSSAGSVDFEATEIVFAFELNLAPLVEKLVQERLTRQKEE